MKVSQKIVIKNTQGKMLALRKSQSDSIRPHTWDLPGGQIEEGEQLEAGVRREVAEETALEISKPKLFHADARNARNGEYWVVLFSETVRLSGEHDMYEWITRDEFSRRESSDRIRELLSSDIAL